MLKNFDFEKMPVVEIVNEIMVDATKRGASDIHFDPLEEQMKIRIRIDGDLIDYAAVPNTIKKNLITRVKILSGMNITESRLPQDGSIKTTLENIDMDMRVSALPTSEGEKIVIRILDYSMSLKGLENLGFNDENYKKVLSMLNVPHGIILVTGATGTGKSTTVYAMIQKLNKEQTNIITVEDPIEMDIEGINQVQTNSEIGLTFANALRSILRQDPNVIMIGEIRDTETAKIAVRASITGHIVLSTVHTNNSLNTIERLLDMEVERYLLASALTGIISQKLARKLCPHCKTKRPTNEYEKELFKKILNKDINEIYDVNGCDHCHNGYLGRIAIHEVLLINQDIKDAISENIRKEDLRELVYKSNVCTLLQDGLQKVVDGETTFEEVLKLIELDDDIKGEKFDLKTAIKYTNISNANNNLNKNVALNDTINNQANEPVKNEGIQAPNIKPNEPINMQANDPLRNVEIPIPNIKLNETTNNQTDELIKKEDIPVSNIKPNNNIGIFDLVKEKDLAQKSNTDEIENFEFKD